MVFDVKFYAESDPIVRKIHKYNTEKKIDSKIQPFSMIWINNVFRSWINKNLIWLNSKIELNLIWILIGSSVKHIGYSDLLKKLGFSFKFFSVYDNI